MPQKFRNRYRIQTTRAKWWDYGEDGPYFVTVCTRYKVHYFGEIEDRKMKNSNIGNIVLDIWNEIPKMFQYAQTGEFILMPNHIHGIVIIDKSIINVLPTEKVNMEDVDAYCLDLDVETRLIASLHLNPNNDPAGSNNDPTGSNNDPTGPNNDPTGSNNDPASLNAPFNNDPVEKARGGITGNNNPMLHQNLSRIMRWFTGRVTYEAHKVDPFFAWQRRFHDHIIRDEREFERISHYIRRNPNNWEKDRFY